MTFTLTTNIPDYIVDLMDRMATACGAELQTYNDDGQNEVIYFDLDDMRRFEIRKRTDRMTDSFKFHAIMTETKELMQSVKQEICGDFIDLLVGKVLKESGHDGLIALATDLEDERAGRKPKPPVNKNIRVELGMRPMACRR
ncbi:MAG: hypothetical protein AB7G06_06740 [Bdellovibrionales bacterium]